LADFVFDERDIEDSGHETLPSEWLEPPTPQTRLHPQLEIGDREPLLARLADADRVVTLPSKANSEDASFSDDEVTGTGAWRTLHPRDAGNLIHKALEHSGWMLVDWPRIERLVRRQWPHPTVDPQDLAEVMAHVRRAVDALSMRYPNPRLRRHEVAFEADVPSVGLLKGIIDLLVQDETGAWHIVDFKTGGVQAHLEVYRTQLSLYREALLRLGIDVASMSLLETETGNFLQTVG
jgi:ATP-dependent exoDNAse (exonuclease V) beta subunit